MSISVTKYDIDWQDSLKQKTLRNFWELNMDDCETTGMHS